MKCGQVITAERGETVIMHVPGVYVEIDSLHSIQVTFTNRTPRLTSRRAIKVLSPNKVPYVAISLFRINAIQIKRSPHLLRCQDINGATAGTDVAINTLSLLCSIEFVSNLPQETRSRVQPIHRDLRSRVRYYKERLTPHLYGFVTGLSPFCRCRRKEYIR